MPDEVESARESSVDPDLEPSIGQSAHRLNLRYLAAVLIGGSFGTFARQALLDAFPTSSQGLGQSILVINATGCLLLGFLVALFFSNRTANVGLRLFLTSGVLGGWTTYSGVTTLSLSLAHQGKMLNAVALWSLTIISNVGFAALGVWIGTTVRTASSR